MHRLALCLLVCLGLVACSDETLTQAQVEAMSDQEAAALLECQGQQVYEEMGQEAGDEYMVELMMGPSDDPEDQLEFLEEGGAIQVDLWEDGYTCPELVP